MEHKHTNENRAYTLAALEAGGRVLFAMSGYIAIDQEDALRVEGDSPFGALVNLARELGLHAQAKAILEEMAGPLPAMDLYGRVLAPEGYVLVPRDVADDFVTGKQLELGGPKFGSVSEYRLFTTLADALGGKKEGIEP